MKWFLFVYIIGVMCTAIVGRIVTIYQDRKHDLKTEYTRQFSVKNKSEIESSVTNVISIMSQRGFVTINLSVKRNDKNVRDSEFIVIVDGIDRETLKEEEK